MYPVGSFDSVFELDQDKELLAGYCALGAYNANVYNLGDGSCETKEVPKGLKTAEEIIVPLYGPKLTLIANAVLADDTW